MYCELFYMCFIVFTTVIKADQPIIPGMKLKLTLSNNNLTCDQTKEKNYSVIALEGALLHMYIEFDKRIVHVKCYDEEHTMVFLYKRNILPNKIIEVSVTKDMGRYWICQISTYRDNSFLNPDGHLNDVAVTECYIKVHVRLIYAPHKMRVNYMLMGPTRNAVEIRDVDHYTEYKYKNGDKVNVFCFKDNDSSNKCNIVMKYYYEELKDHKLELISTAVVQSYIELHMKHSGSYIDCMYTCERDIQVQRMKFVLGNDFNNGMKLVINGQEARLNTDKSYISKSAYSTISAPYHIFQHEHFDIKCGEDEEYNCHTVCLHIFVEKCVKLEINNINYGCIFYCEDSIFSLAIMLNIQTTKAFKNMRFQYLSLIFPNNNTVMNFLYDKERIIYYEFDDNDEMEVSCIRHPLDSVYITYISTTNNHKADISSNMQNDTLKMSHHGVYTCALYETLTASDVLNVMYKITVVFIKKKIDIIQVTTSDPLEQFYLSLSVSNNTAVMTYTSYKECVVYYEFDHNDDIASVTCSKMDKSLPKTYLSTTNTNNTDTMPTTINDTLVMRPHNKFTCYLYQISTKDKDDKTLINKITVEFINKAIASTELTTMASPETNSPGINYITIILTVFAVVLMIAVAYITYWCYRKAKSTKNQRVLVKFDVNGSSAAITQDSQTNQMPGQSNAPLINEEHQCDNTNPADDPNKIVNPDFTDVVHHEYAEIIYDSHNNDYVDTYQYDYVEPSYDPKAQVLKLKFK